MALIRNRHVVWTSCREPHLGSGHVRPRQQAGHMIASDPIRCCRHSCKPGAVHIWVSQELDPTYDSPLHQTDTNLALFASAANPKFAHTSRRTLLRTSGSKAALEP